VSLTAYKKIYYLTMLPQIVITHSLCNEHIQAIGPSSQTKNEATTTNTHFGPVKKTSLACIDRRYPSLRHCEIKQKSVLIRRVSIVLMAIARVSQSAHYNGQPLSDRGSSWDKSSQHKRERTARLVITMSTSISKLGIKTEIRAMHRRPRESERRRETNAEIKYHTKRKEN